jgi:serine/threonine-protein phosphatase 2A regulatory subunit A
MYNTIS